MAEERNYYVICDDNCRFPAMTKEEVIAAIAEATGATPTHIDDAFITKIKELNKNGNMTFWIGSRAEYNALPENQKNIQNRFYIFYDEGEMDDIEADVAELKAKFETLNTKVSDIEDEMEKKGVVLFDGELSYGDISPAVEIDKKIINYSTVIVETGKTKMLCTVRKNDDNLYLITGTNISSLSGAIDASFYLDMACFRVEKNGEQLFITSNRYRWFEYSIVNQAGSFLPADTQNYKIIGIM